VLYCLECKLAEFSYFNSTVRIKLMLLLILLIGITLVVLIHRKVNVAVSR